MRNFQVGVFSAVPFPPYCAYEKGYNAAPRCRGAFFLFYGSLHWSVTAWNCQFAPAARSLRKRLRVCCWSMRKLRCNHANNIRFQRATRYLSVCSSEKLCTRSPVIGIRNAHKLIFQRDFDLRYRFSPQKRRKQPLVFFIGRCQMDRWRRANHLVKNCLADLYLFENSHFTVGNISCVKVKLWQTSLQNRETS